MLFRHLFPSVPRLEALCGVLNAQKRRCRGLWESTCEAPEIAVERGAPTMSLEECLDREVPGGSWWVCGDGFENRGTMYPQTIQNRILAIPSRNSLEMWKVDESSRLPKLFMFDHHVSYVHPPLSDAPVSSGPSSFSLINVWSVHSSTTFYRENTTLWDLPWSREKNKLAIPWLFSVH